jgi:hypothetical protein
VLCGYLKFKEPPVPVFSNIPDSQRGHLPFLKRTQRTTGSGCFKNPKEPLALRKEWVVNEPPVICPDFFNKK